MYARCSHDEYARDADLAHDLEDGAIRGRVGARSDLKSGVAIWWAKSGNYGVTAFDSGGEGFVVGQLTFDDLEIVVRLMDYVKLRAMVHTLTLTCSLMLLGSFAGLRANTRKE